MTLFFILAAVFAALLILLLTRKRVKCSLILSRAGIAARASLWRFCFVRSFPFDALLRVAAMREKKKKRKKRGIRITNIKGGVALCAVKISGRLGIREDAAGTAFLCGVMRCFFEAALGALSHEAIESLEIRPDFNNGVFWLYMEGILTLYPGKIIAMLIGKWVKEEFEKWRILSRTLWRRPWQNSGTWSM